MSDEKSAVEQQQVIGAEVAAPKTKSEKEADKALAEFSRVEDNGQLSMKVKVHSPFRDYYDGQAFSVSAENATGQFDILAKHHNFISLLSPCELVVRSVSDGEKKIRISGGIMHVKADQVIVFLDV
jgi:hypothetical protein